MPLPSPSWGSGHSGLPTQLLDEAQPGMMPTGPSGLGGVTPGPGVPPGPNTLSQTYGRESPQLAERHARSLLSVPQFLDESVPGLPLRKLWYRPLKALPLAPPLQNFLASLLAESSHDHSP